MGKCLVVTKGYINITTAVISICNTKVRYNQGRGNPGISSKSSTNTEERSCHALLNCDTEVETAVSTVPGNLRAVDMVVLRGWVLFADW